MRALASLHILDLCWGGLTNSMASFNTYPGSTGY
jgi:cytochrome b